MRLMKCWLMSSTASQERSNKSNAVVGTEQPSIYIMSFVVLLIVYVNRLATFSGLIWDIMFLFCN